MKLDSSRIPLPDARSLTLQMGAGRALMAAGVMAAPVPAARLLGADTATAQRVTWLTRMMAVRDGALGVGTAGSARSGHGSATWLLGGAVSDAVDAIVIAGAIQQGRVKGVLPTAIVVGAVGAAALGFFNASRVHRA